MEKNMSLYILPNEILLIIFNYCDRCDLTRLNSVCKRFYDIISKLLKKRSDHLLVTGQMSEKFCKRCQPLLSSYTSKFFTNYMWKYGKYERKMIDLKSTLISMKLIHAASSYPRENWTDVLMTKDTIVVGHIKDYPGHYLCANNRTKNDSLSDNWFIEECNSPISIIVLCNDVIVSSHRDNSIREWTIKSLRGRKYFEQKLLHSAELCNVSEFTVNMDVTSRNIVTSSTNGKIKIWKYTPQKDTIEKIITLKSNEFDDKYYVFSLAFDFTGTKLAVNCRSHNDLLNCRIYDINNSCTEKYEKIDFTNMRPYIRQLLWEDPNTILCLGNTQIIKIDVRTHKAVCKWSLLNYQEHTRNWFTCLSSDNLYAIMTGMASGQVVLWDQRHSTFTQRYDVCNNPIWNLEFDSSHMFMVADKELYELDFPKYSSYTRTN